MEMKKGLQEFKEEVLNGHTFDGKFKNITSMEEVYQIAKEEGYEFSQDELEDCEISDDILDSVAGGKDNKTCETYRFNKSEGTRANFYNEGSPNFNGGSPNFNGGSPNFNGGSPKV